MADKNQKTAKRALFMYLHTSKENRLEEVKERYAGGKLSGLNNVYREKMNDVMKTNLLFTLFCAPFLVLTIWALGYMLNLSDQRFFIGGIGVDYHPGVVNELQAAILARLDVHMFYFLLLIPGFTIIGLGLSGAMYIARKMFYGEEYKVLRTYGQGIKKYSIKMMVVMTLIGAVICAVASCFIQFFKLDAMGLVTGGWYAILVFAVLFGFLAILCLMQIPAQIVTYDKLKFRYMFANSGILAIENILWSVLLLALITLSVVLAVVVPMFSILIYMVLFMFGFMYFIMASLQIGNYAFDLYMNPMYDMLGEEALPRRNSKKQREEENVKQQTEQKAQAKPKQKKPAPQKYVNPKKKKSQKK